MGTEAQVAPWIPSGVLIRGFGFDSSTGELREVTPKAHTRSSSWDMFDAVEAVEQDATLPEEVRLQNICVIRDYGMFDRSEAPQYFTEVHPKT